MSAVSALLWRRLVRRCAWASAPCFSSLPCGRREVALVHGFSVWRSVLRLPAVVKDRDQAVKVAITANERRWRPSNGGPAGGPDWSQSPSERIAKHDAWRVMVVGDRSVTHAVIPADPDLLVFERPTVLAEPSALANRGTVAHGLRHGRSRAGAFPADETGKGRAEDGEADGPRQGA